LEETAIYELQCRDAGFDCPGTLRGATKEDLLKQAAEHAADVHGTQLTPALAEKASALIR
jgi:predicted small metal-binding protein